MYRFVKQSELALTRSLLKNKQRWRMKGKLQKNEKRIFSSTQKVSEGHKRKIIAKMFSA